MRKTYLNVGNGKHYRTSVEEHLKVIAELESVNANRLVTALKLTDVGKDYVILCLTDCTLFLGTVSISKTFAR